MNALHSSLLGGACLLAALSASAQTAPPYAGTIFLDPDIIVPADATVFQQAVYTGRGQRTVYDRRVNAWVSVNAYLYRISFTDGTAIEAQVNPEFGSADAGMAQAQAYGPPVGQLPAVLRRDIDALWIHMGTQPFGGGNRSLLIHTGQTALYVRDGILEETLVHEAAHTSLDARHAASAGWLAAQRADPTFISTYARDNPTREDVAESVLPYLAVRHRADRVSQAYRETAARAMPNRMAYLDAQAFDLRPFAPSSVDVEPVPGVPGVAFTVSPNPVRAAARLHLTLDRPRAVRIEIVDLLGRVAVAVADGPLPAGDSVHPLAVSGLAPGLYVCRVVVDGATVSRPLTVVE